MTDHVARLDAALARSGQDVVLRRVIGGAEPIYIDVTCRAHVRDYQPAELIGGIVQGDTRVILSPTQIIAAQWPGGAPITSPPAEIDPRVPREDDRILIAGRDRNVSAAVPFYIGADLVRIELLVRG